VLGTAQSRYDRRSGELANQRSRERRKRKKSEMRGGDRVLDGRISLRLQLVVWEFGAVHGMKIACLDVGKRKIGGIREGETSMCRDVREKEV
jgi:hypothetical protein